MDESACLWKQLKWNNFAFYGDRLFGNTIHGINIARQRVWENPLMENLSPLIRQQVLWGNYSEQPTGKKNKIALKFAPSP